MLGLFEQIGTDADLSQTWLSHQTAVVAGRPCLLARVSFAGELGWEVHAENEHIPALYESVIGAGAKPFGMWALNSLRLEKGYRTWKGDLSTDYSVLQSGLERFVKWDKPDFVGKAAMEVERQQGISKRFTTLVIDAPEEFDAPYMATIWKDGEIVGEVTSGGWGYRVGKSIALGMVKPELATEGTALEIDIFGTRFAATVQADAPLWDRDNERLRA